jgi:type I restriction enzyme S subunit
VGEFLTLTRDPVLVRPDKVYATLGLLNRGRGVFAREPVAGSETKYITYYRVKANQLIYSKLFGWEGSVAIVPEQYRDYCVSAEFPTFDIDASIALPAYVAHLIRWSGFTAQLSSATTGMGQRRQRVNIADFEAIEVPLPNVSKQLEVVAQLDRLTRTAGLIQRRATLARALLPAARNEVFSSLR